MGLRGTLFALTYDRQIRRTEAAGLADIRRRVLDPVGGRVLEIGAGTGANLRHYGPGVEALTLTEPEPAMERRLLRHVADVRPGAVVVRAPAEDLPFLDGSFDVVVSTLVLCGVSDQQRVLRQVRRVLRPGGRFVFVEHVRSDEDRLARRQDLLNPLNRAIVCCDCNRPTLRSIEAELTVEDVQRSTLPKAPSFVRPLIIGTAVAPVTSRLAGSVPR